MVTQITPAGRLSIKERLKANVKNPRPVEVLEERKDTARQRALLKEKMEELGQVGKKQQSRKLLPSQLINPTPPLTNAFPNELTTLSSEHLKEFGQQLNIGIRLMDNRDGCQFIQKEAPADRTVDLVYDDPSKNYGDVFPAEAVLYSHTFDTKGKAARFVQFVTYSNAFLPKLMEAEVRQKELAGYAPVKLLRRENALVILKQEEDRYKIEHGLMSIADQLQLEWEKKTAYNEDEARCRRELQTILDRREAGELRTKSLQGRLEEEGLCKAQLAWSTQWLDEVAVASSVVDNSAEEDTLKEGKLWVNSALSVVASVVEQSEVAPALLCALAKMFATTIEFEMEEARLTAAHTSGSVSSSSSSSSSPSITESPSS